MAGLCTCVVYGVASESSASPTRAATATSEAGVKCVFVVAASVKPKEVCGSSVHRDANKAQHRDVAAPHTARGWRFLAPATAIHGFVQSRA